MKKRALLLVVIIVAMVGALAYSGIYVPYQRQVELIQAQKAQEQANQQTQADVASLLHTIEQYHKRLPTEPDPSWLVRETVALAQKAGVQVTNISQEDPQPFAGFTRLAVNLQFAASYHQLGAFLDDIEHADRFIRVDRINVNHTTARNEPLASVQLVFSTIYLPPALPTSS